MRRALRTIVLLAGVLLGGATLWLYTPDLPPGPLEARYTSAASRFIEIDGGRLHVRDEGPRDAPAIVLVHGLGGSLHVWEDWVVALSSRYRVISFDLPGHGLTGPWPQADYSIERSARLIGALADTLGLERFAIAGHSMGGMIAWYAAADPLRARTTALILIDASGYPAGSALPVGLQLARLPLIGEAVTWLRRPEDIGRSLRRSVAEPGRITPTMLARQADLTRRAGNRAAQLQRLRNFTAPNPRLIASIAVPTLILWGREDPLLPLDNAQHFNRDIVGSKLVIFAHTGHYPMLEQAAISAKDAEQFLEGLR